MRSGLFRLCVGHGLEGYKEEEGRAAGSLVRGRIIGTMAFGLIERVSAPLNCILV